jgi:hypothetical protein
MFSFILVIAIYDPDFARQPKVAGPALAFLARSVSFEVALFELWVTLRSGIPLV